jgi:AcrR family transcriptional regulator
LPISDPKPARPKRRPYLPAAERRASIIAAARGVFAQVNLKGARTRDIAAAAGVNQATIFEHFASKEALFHAAVVEPLIEAMQVMHGRVEVYDTAATPAEMGEMAEGATARHIQGMIDIFPLMTAALFSEPELGREIYREQIAPLLRERGAVLAPLVKEGIDPQLVGLTSFGMLFAVAMDRWFGEGGGDLAATAAQFNRLSTTGFARETSRLTTREKDDGREKDDDAAT